MIQAKYDDDRRAINSVIDGSTLDVIGELAALIEAVRDTLKKTIRRNCGGRSHSEHWARRIFRGAATRRGYLQTVA